MGEMDALGKGQSHPLKRVTFCFFEPAIVCKNVNTPRILFNYNKKPDIKECGIFSQK